MLILSASAVLLLCGVSGFTGYESWQKNDVAPVEIERAALIPEAAEAVPVPEVSVPSIPDEVPAVELKTPEVESVSIENANGEGENTPVFFQLQYLPTEQGYFCGHNRKVCGLALGYYLPQNEIYGVSMALMHMYNMRKYGLSVSILEMSGEVGGLTIFLAGGAVNNYGLSVGLLNMSENNYGLQLGLVNMDEKDLLLNYPQKPQQDDEQNSFGVQAGLVNFSDSKGIQFGLLNVNPNSLIKYFPLFNICF